MGVRVTVIRAKDEGHSWVGKWQDSIWDVTFEGVWGKLRGDLQFSVDNMNLEVKSLKTKILKLPPWMASPREKLSHEDNKKVKSITLGANHFREKHWPGKQIKEKQKSRNNHQKKKQTKTKNSQCLLKVNGGEFQEKNHK